MQIWRSTFSWASWVWGAWDMLCSEGCRADHTQSWVCSEDSRRVSAESSWESSYCNQHLRHSHFLLGWTQLCLPIEWLRLSRRPQISASGLLTTECPAKDFPRWNLLWSFWCSDEWQLESWSWVQAWWWTVEGSRCCHERWAGRGAQWWRAARTERPPPSAHMWDTAGGHLGPGGGRSRDAAIYKRSQWNLK